MSAFLCNDKHLSILADALNKHIFEEGKNSKDIFRDMKQLNIESINYRYNDNIPNADCTGYVKCYKSYNLYQLLKAAHCYAYQSCEIPNYAENETFKLNKDLIRKLEDIIVTENLNYIESDWEIE